MNPIELHFNKFIPSRLTRNTQIYHLQCEQYFSIEQVMLDSLIGTLSSK